MLKLKQKLFGNVYILHKILYVKFSWWCIYRFELKHYLHFRSFLLQPTIITMQISSSFILSCHAIIFVFIFVLNKHLLLCTYKREWAWCVSSCTVCSVLICCVCVCVCLGGGTRWFDHINISCNWLFITRSAFTHITSEFQFNIL